MDLNNIDDLSFIKIAKVAIDGAAYYFDKLYDYIVPIEIKDDVFVGQRVAVPFGKGNKKKIGLILKILEFKKSDFNRDDKSLYFTPTGLAIKPISDIIDKQKVLSKEMIKIIFWLKKNTFCKYFDALKVVLPSGYNISLIKKYKINKDIIKKFFDYLSEEEKILINILETEKNKKDQLTELTVGSLTKTQQKILNNLISKNIISENDIFKRKIQDNKALMVKIDDKFNNFIDNIDNNYKLTQKQRKVINFINESEAASVKEVLYLCGVTRSVLDNLNKKNILGYFEVDVYKNNINKDFINPDQEFNYNIKLNLEQKNVFDKLINLIDKKQPEFALLRGITGSGKTVIFISLIKYVINKNKNVILLVPEISLTPQMIETLRKYFGNFIAVLHSGLTLSSRLSEWKRIKNGEAKIVVGTRSAIFAPVENIGLIIMDEEQESSYKSENSPRYHARDIASLRASYNNALFLMASATPCVETYYKIKKNKFNIFYLNKRYNNSRLPDISVIDMKKEKQNGNLSFFSEKLILSLEDNLNKKNQSIIFINRRGYNTVIKCEECGSTQNCPNCSIALTYHRTNNKLICHYCGFTKNIIKKCDNCGSVYLKYDGVGTQKIESQLEDIFPKARILRLDSDTIVTRYSYDKYFTEFLNKKYDILIGTQMIAKGLNFPGVTLVGVIDADSSLYISDYRAVEQTYNIITQVIGRSGRGEQEGKAIIQTNSADNEIFDLIINQNYENFYNQEILMRKNLLYPPFCDMAIIGLVGSDERVVIETGNEIFEIIKYLVSSQYKDIKLKMFGPISETISRVNNKFRYKIFLKYKNNIRFKQMIDLILIKILKEKQKLGINIFFDKI
ncbi:MAG: primosomal protein N' [Oscillospiraceae bacterium]|nr:primosomal protein N' [Oscillospiraceae bacterium]